MPKKCLRPGCTHNAWGGGYCQYDQYLRPKEEKRPPKDRGLFVREAPAAEDPANDILNAWFKAREFDIMESGCTCWECGQRIPTGIAKYYQDKIGYVDALRNATAHIFPKSIFPSIATHPLNFLALGAGCGCHDKTHTIESFCKMKIWPEAVERFQQFQHLITEKHKYLTLFIEAIKNTTHGQ